MTYSRKLLFISLLSCFWFFSLPGIMEVYGANVRLSKPDPASIIVSSSPQTPLTLKSYMAFNGVGSSQPDEGMLMYLQSGMEIETSSVKQESETQTFWQKTTQLYLSASLKAKILIGILAYLLLSIMVLFIAILVNRQLKTTKRKKIKELKNEYQEQLAAFLFDDEIDRIEFTGIDIRQNRQIFIDELRVLHSNLYGETADKLRDLYFNLELHKDSLRKVYHRKWHQKAKGFREVAQMDVKDANEHIVSFVNSKNPIIRVEAQVAMVKLSEENPLAFLDNLKYELSEWEQMNIYDSLQYHQTNIDSFEPWLESENLSVVQFALRMIGLFKHMHSAPKVHNLITHEDPRIRLAAVKAIKSLEIAEYIPDLKELFRRETHDLMIILHEQREGDKKEILSLDDLLARKIRYAIVECFEAIASPDDLDFLSEIASDHESSFKIRILAIRIIASLHPEGDTHLEKLLSQADEILKSMIINVKQNLES